ncbi:MAG: YabP/YqfC family sporulation protein [Clostridia bacterium]|nr:YabP/YqfC family sporulation protein [Clostridia bacterium]
MRKKRKESKLENFLELPKELTTTQPKITMLGFEEMLIENYKGILEYEDFYIRLATYIGIININGFNLNLNQMKEDTILVTGKIDSIDLENDIEE